MCKKNSSKLKRLFEIIPCHRLDDRSFHFKGKKSPLCSRCMSIYSSIFILLIPMYFLIDLNINLLFLGFLLLIPLVVDGFTQLWKWRKSNNVLRTLTGIAFGIGYNIILVMISKYIIDFIINLV